MIMLTMLRARIMVTISKTLIAMVTKTISMIMKRRSRPPAQPTRWWSRSAASYPLQSPAFSLCYYDITEIQIQIPIHSTSSQFFKNSWKVFHLTELQSHVNSQTVWAEIGSSQTRIISYKTRWSCYWFDTQKWNIDHIICKWFASNTCLQQVWSVGRSLPASCCKAVLHPGYFLGLEHFQYSSLIVGDWIKPMQCLFITWLAKQARKRCWKTSQGNHILPCNIVFFKFVLLYCNIAFFTFVLVLPFNIRIFLDTGILEKQ